MELKRCPYCGEQILAIAKVCKHCGRSLDPQATPQPSQSENRNQEKNTPSPFDVDAIDEKRQRYMAQDGVYHQTKQPPKTWLTESILVTLFCCLPFGIAGIVNASKVESAFLAGNITEAYRRSAEAAKWTKIAFWLGLVGIVIYAIAVVAGVIDGVDEYY
jgi:hypothetical protein